MQEVRYKLEQPLSEVSNNGYKYNSNFETMPVLTIDTHRNQGRNNLLTWDSVKPLTLRSSVLLVTTMQML